MSCAPRASHTIITVNASHLCMMRRDPNLALACASGDLTVADGISIVWALRALGQHLPERVAGIDLMVHLLAATETNGLSVYFLGARREVVERLVERCRARHPKIKIAGFRDGYFKPSDHQTIIEKVRASGAHILFVGMPSPFKETWCELHRERLAVPVIVGVGGSFDVLAGFISRATLWVQSIGFESSWRLLMEPRRLRKRYLMTNSEFVWLVGREIVAPFGSTVAPSEEVMQIIDPICRPNTKVPNGAPRSDRVRRYRRRSHPPSCPDWLVGSVQIVAVWIYESASS